MRPVRLSVDPPSAVRLRLPPAPAPLHPKREWPNSLLVLLGCMALATTFVGLGWGLPS
jgi:hypothetical protein